MCSGAAATGAEAEKLAKALCRAGVVLRHRDTVFLRPAEVAAAVLQVRAYRMEAGVDPSKINHITCWLCAPLRMPPQCCGWGAH